MADLVDLRRIHTHLEVALMHLDDVEELMEQEHFELFRNASGALEVFYSEVKDEIARLEKQ